METTIKEEQGLKRKVELIIPQEQVDASFSKNLKKIQQNTEIQGFRKGKAPLESIEQNFYKKAWESVMSELFESFYPKVLKENKLTPAGQPKLLDIQLEQKKPCTFLFEVEVHPSIEVKNYLKLKVKKQEVKITDENVSQTLERLRDSFASYKDSLEVRPLKKEDSVLISLEGSLNGTPIKELNHPELLLQLGNDKLASGFDQNLMGLQVGGEKSFNFLFPKDHAYTSIANQQVSMKVKIKALKVKEVPPLDDALAERFKIKTLKELKEKIHKDLEDTQQQKAKESMENEIVTQLVENNPITNIPQSLIEDQKKSLITNARKRLEDYGMNAQQQEVWIKEQDAQFEQEARFNIHSGYLLEQLMQDLKLQTTPEDIQKALQESFPSKNPEDMKKDLQKHNYWNQFLFHLNRKKVISYLIEKATVSH
ncbi:MAG: trigger factor [Bdellovibrionales bacterium]